MIQEALLKNSVSQLSHPHQSSLDKVGRAGGTDAGEPPLSPTAISQPSCHPNKAGKSAAPLVSPSPTALQAAT